MSNFNNDQYLYLAQDVIGDVFYVETSYRGKIKTLRQYAEIIIRKILDIDPDAEMTVGGKKNYLKKVKHYDFLETAVDRLHTKGNATTHTQYRGDVTEDEFKDAVDNIFDLLAYLLISYFSKYTFGTRNDIVHVFSLLPPIIRYKVLNYLYEKDPTNVMIIDKLVLATLKAFDKETATEWVESRQAELSELKIEHATPIGIVLKENMYNLCAEKINLVGQSISEKGVLYSDFESALPYYKEHGFLEGNDEETIMFNDIMEFLYLGRKEEFRKVTY